MKTKLLLLAAIAFASVSSFGQTVNARKTLPFYEGFNYNEDSKLLTEGQITGQGGWQTFNTDVPAVSPAATNPVIVSSPGWNMGSLPVASANALRYWGGGDDPVLNFTDQGTTFAIYSSFIFRINDAVDPEVDLWDDTIGEYIYSFGKTSTANTVNYCSNVYLKKTSAAAKTFNIGVAETNTTAAGRLVWTTGTYNYNTDIRIVIKYQIDAANPGGISTIWVDPITTSTTEIVVSNTPTASTANTFTDETTSARTNLDKIRIMKSSNAKTPYIILDEIRVGNTWNNVAGPGATILSVAKNDIQGLNVYPNPVTNGKLFISSNSGDVKTVAIYDILGKQVLSKEVTSGQVSVSSLNKGVYVLKITEAGKTSTRKIVIE